MRTDNSVVQTNLPGSMTTWKRVLVYRYDQDEVPTAVIQWSRSLKDRLQGAYQDQVEDEGQQEVGDDTSLLHCEVRIQPDTDGP